MRSTDPDESAIKSHMAILSSVNIFKHLVGDVDFSQLMASYEGMKSQGLDHRELLAAALVKEDWRRALQEIKAMIGRRDSEAMEDGEIDDEYDSLFGIFKRRKVKNSEICHSVSESFAYVLKQLSETCNEKPDAPLNNDDGGLELPERNQTPEMQEDSGSSWETFKSSKSQDLSEIPALFHFLSLLDCPMNAFTIPKIPVHRYEVIIKSHFNRTTKLYFEHSQAKKITILDLRMRLLEVFGLDFALIEEGQYLNVMLDSTEINWRAFEVQENEYFYSVTFFLAPFISTSEDWDESFIDKDLIFFHFEMKNMESYICTRYRHNPKCLLNNFCRMICESFNLDYKSAAINAIRSDFWIKYKKDQIVYFLNDMLGDWVLRELDKRARPARPVLRELVAKEEKNIELIGHLLKTALEQYKDSQLMFVKIARSDLTKAKKTIVEEMNKISAFELIATMPPEDEGLDQKLVLIPVRATNSGERSTNDSFEVMCFQKRCLNND